MNEYIVQATLPLQKKLAEFKKTSHAEEAFHKEEKKYLPRILSFGGANNFFPFEKLDNQTIQKNEADNLSDRISELSFKSQ